MRFHYLVAAHNEEENVKVACRRILTLDKQFPETTIALLDNGSVDNTWAECLKLQNIHPKQITALHEDQAGIGVAFRMGLKALEAASLGREDWIVLAAADLPFGFSDLEAVISTNTEDKSDVWVYVGSKAHLRSVVSRKWRRRAATLAFYLLRKMILGLETKDTQGSIFIRGDIASRLSNFKSNDYFFSVEIIDQAERHGRVVEVPVVLEPETRPSSVQLVRDGWRMLWQLIALRTSRS